MSAIKLFRTLFAQTAKPRQRSVRLGYDSLERRDTPSGTVSAVLRGKTWQITGDSEANNITINPTGNGSFTLTGTDTALTGITQPTGVENIVVRMGEGNDTVTLNTTGANNVLVGRLWIDNSNGANKTAINDMTINGTLTIRNGTSTSGKDETYIYDTSVNGSVVINNGHGDTKTEIARTIAGTSTLGADLRIANGTGLDDTAVTDMNLNRHVVVRNGAPDSNSNPGKTQFFNHYNTSQSTILGSVTVAYSDGMNSVGERDGIWDYEVRGNVVFNYGRGAGKVAFDGYSIDAPTKIHGNLTIRANGTLGEDLVIEVANSDYKERGLQVVGNLYINSGRANDQLYLYRLTVGGRTLIVTGLGDDSVTIDDSSFNLFHLDTHKGNDKIHLDYSDGTTGVTSFAGITNIYLSQGNDELVLGYLDDPTYSVSFSAFTRIYGYGGQDVFFENNYDLLNGAVADIRD